MYFGGKSRIVKDIMKVMRYHIPERELFVDAFCGSAVVSMEAALYFKKVIANDSNTSLIMLHNAVKDGWTPPTSMSYEEWDELRNQEEPSALKAFAGFWCSYSGMWFQAFARDPSGKRNYARTASRKMDGNRAVLRRIDFENLDYMDFFKKIPSNASVVYLDPPYKGTGEFSGVGKFSSTQFWKLAEKLATRLPVFVSEYNAPEGWDAIWQKEVMTSVNNQSGKAGSAVEKLFIYRDGVVSKRKGFNK